MCKVSDQIKFCTCNSDSYEDLPHYWLLYRINHDKFEHVLGEAMMSFDFLQPHFELNKEILVKRLNEPDSFDKPMDFKPDDQLKIVINNLAKDEQERMLFCFRYENGKWVEEEFHVFDLMIRYDELEFGKLEDV